MHIQENIKKKREEGYYSCWVSLIVFLTFTTTWIIYSNYFHIKPEVIVLFSFLSVICLALSIELMFKSEPIKIAEFIIFEFDFWDINEREYVKAYDYGITEFCAKYIMHFQDSTFISSTTPEMIEEKFSTKCSYNGYEQPFKTKEELMEKLLKYAETVMKKQGASENIRIKGISINETISLNELMEKIINEKKTKQDEN